ncbi:centromere protein K isoform X2 [Suncus etruscus]|uniref:centromere protein K isoform X2 n=1 Tax=Suncus etruscus TaxID=109475 RepID=UPI0021106D4F|nr:centromere protein K isoform X2 [Suncus etruscus]
MWKDIVECQNKLSFVGTETLTTSDAQLSLLNMHMRCLTAELNQWQKETPDIIPLDEDALVTLENEEFKKLKHDLELVLSTIQSKNEKLKEDLERTFKELKTKLHDIKEYKEKLLISLGEFLEDHFSLPDQNAKKKKKNVQGSNAQLITLHEMLEILLNRLFAVPHDPYVKITDSFWPPYIELLLRNGIALRHPEDPSKIRIEAFHQ